MKLKQIHAEVWLGGILIILAVIFYIMAGQFPNASAAVWPKAVLIGIMILSVLLVIHGLQMTKDADGNADLGGAVLKGPMASLVMIVAYAVCMSFTGYFVSTAIFLPLGMALFGPMADAFPLSWIMIGSGGALILMGLYSKLL